MKVFGYVPNLLGHRVAVNHEHQRPCRAAEHVHHLAPHPLASRDVHQLNPGLAAVRGVGELVVLHTGVGLHTSSTHQLRQDGCLSTVTNSTDQNIYDGKR